MDKCWELVNGDNGDRWGMFKNRADAEEMCLAWAEEVAYWCFLWEHHAWNVDLDLALLLANDALWRIEIHEYDLI